MVPVPVNGAGNFVDTYANLSLFKREAGSAVGERSGDSLPVPHAGQLTCTRCIVKITYLTTSWDRYCCSIYAGSMVSICST